MKASEDRDTEENDIEKNVTSRKKRQGAMKERAIVTTAVLTGLAIKAGGVAGRVIVDQATKTILCWFGICG